MAAFDDSFDPELGVACNRLAAWVESLPQDALIDPASQLGEQDLALILRHLYATRLDAVGERAHVQTAPHPAPRASVPVTAKN